jgi:predicted secreted protein
MAAQKGKDLLLKVDSTGAGAFTTVAGLRARSIAINAASDATLRDYAFNGTIRNWQIVAPDFGVIEGPFQIASLEFSGRHDGEVAFELGIESAGMLSFTAD